MKAGRKILTTAAMDSKTTELSDPRYLATDASSNPSLPSVVGDDTRNPFRGAKPKNTQCSNLKKTLACDYCKAEKDGAYYICNLMLPPEIKKKILSDTKLPGPICRECFTYISNIIGPLTRDNPPELPKPPEGTGRWVTAQHQQAGLETAFDQLSISGDADSKNKDSSANYQRLCNRISRLANEFDPIIEVISAVSGKPKKCSTCQYELMTCFSQKNENKDQEAPRSYLPIFAKTKTRDTHNLCCECLKILPEAMVPDPICNGELYALDRGKRKYFSEIGKAMAMECMATPIETEQPAPKTHSSDGDIEALTYTINDPAIINDIIQQHMEELLKKQPAATEKMLIKKIKNDPEFRGNLTNNIIETANKLIDPIKEHCKTLAKSNETLQEVIAVFNNQMEAQSEKISGLERQNRHFQETIEQQDRQLHAHDQMLTVKNVALAEQELRIQSLESAAYNGILVWKISDFARRRRDAISGKTTSFYSPAFFTSYHGYKMRTRIYLNGDGMGKGTHLSLFFVVMKGNYGNILDWPFRQKVTFLLFDQGNRKHVTDSSFQPDPTSSSFKKPTHEMNIASGYPLFASLSALDNSNYAYIKDDYLFVKVVVDVTDLERI